MWLAFPEFDRCFASIENRMKDALDLDGNEYAVLVPAPYDRARAEWTEEFDAKYPLLGELRDTAYGTIRVYYTGTVPEHRALESKSYQFLGDRRGYVSAASLADAKQVWAIGGANDPACMAGAPESDDYVYWIVNPPRTSSPVELCSVELKPETFYQIEIDFASERENWQMLAVDGEAGTVNQQVPLDAKESERRTEGLFRTSGSGKVKLAVQHYGKNKDDILRIRHIIIREIAEGQ
jgi:hypothetical protein